MKARILLVAAASIILTSCGGDTTSATTTEAPTTSEAPTAATTATEAATTDTALGARPPDALRILTYNIYFGGDAWAGGQPTDLLDTLLVYDADIIGIQEANGWDQNGFARIEEVATALDMEYAYCKAQDSDDPSFSGDTIILSRFEILSAEAYPEIRHCMGVAEVRLPDGRSLHVVNVHIPQGDSQCTELLDEALPTVAPSGEDLAVMIGDFNFADSNPADAHPCNARMLGAEWTELTCDLRRCGQIDRIWVSKPWADLEYFPWIANYLVDHKIVSEISDHRPTAVDIFGAL